MGRVVECPPPQGTRRVGILGKLLFSRNSSLSVSRENSCSRDSGGGGKKFVGVGNDLPAVLPHASPWLKILMAAHWCCRMNSTGRVLAESVSWETLVLEKLGVKVHRGLGDVQNEDIGPKQSFAPGVPFPEA